MSASTSTLLRALALLAVLGNVAFNYLYVRLGLGPPMDEVSARYATAFTPANYAFAIWGVIYAAFVVYGVQSLRLAQRREPAYDAIALPLVAANVLGTAWILAYTHGYLSLAVVLIVASAIAGARMFRQAARFAPARNSRWLRVPFSLYFGWITVATLACIAQWVQARGWVAPGAEERALSIGFLLATGAAGFTVAERYREPVYPAVAAWAAAAIFVAQMDDHPAVAWTALAVAVALASFAAYALRAADAETRVRSAYAGRTMLGESTSAIAPRENADARR